MQLLKLSASVIIIINLFGCAILNTGATYDYSFAILKKNKLTNVVDTSTALYFEDSNISIGFTVGDKTISFVLKNKTSETLKLNWDDATYIQSGIAKRVIHSTTKYIDKDKPQLATNIPASSMISDLVVPSDNITYYSSLSATGMPIGWVVRELFGVHDFNKPEIQKQLLAQKGNSFSIYLPLQQKGSTIEYKFDFIIRDVHQTIKSNPVSLPNTPIEP